MLIIRLQRTGKKNAADFRLVIAEKTASAKKKFVEVLGSYNPRTKAFQAKEERLKYWLGQRVEISPTVHNLLVGKNLLEAKKVKAFSVPKKPVEPVVETKPAAPAAPLEAAAAEQPAAQEAPVETPAA
ncbi:MAG: 30S ribosomal protein S16 [Patescibacteria group bacterium]|nr:30S ribosomal protein S16 [Patescibacteria group bacterium]